MEFLVLGPLEVRDGDRILSLGGAKQRAALAMLLLNRNQVVSRDRLVDGIWGDTPPASAAHTLETYISRLRKVLHDDGQPERLITHQPGYLLRVDDGELDLQRLDAQMDRGRRALAADDPQAAAAELRQALALFRGGPLEDLAYTPFAAIEIGRLDDLRAAALEQRIDADLALGRHADLIGELETLVTMYPLREHAWSQLMLARYRSGRQGEALATFDRARHQLADELGIAPGPSLQQLQQQILLQDPTLQLSQPTTSGRQHGVTFVDSGRHRVKGLVERVHVFRAVFPLDMPDLSTTRPAPRTLNRVAAIALVGFVVFLVAVAWATTRGGTPAAVGVVVRANSLVKIDVKSHRVVGDVPLHAEPGKVVSGGGYLWVAEEGRESMVRVDPKTLDATPDGIGIDPSELAYGDSSLWAYDPLGGSVAQVDPNLEQDPTPTFFRLPPCLTEQTLQNYRRYGCKLGGIVVGEDGSVWIGREVVGGRANPPGGAIWKIDPTSASPTATLTVRDAVAARLAYGGGSIWTSSWYGDAYASQVDATTPRVIKTWPEPGGFGGGSQSPGLTWGFGYTWLVSPRSGDLLKLGSQSNEVGSRGFVGNVSLPPGSQEVAVCQGFLWVTSNAGTLTQINPYTLTVVNTYRLGHPSLGVTCLRSHIWVSVTNP